MGRLNKTKVAGVFPQGIPGPSGPPGAKGLPGEPVSVYPISLVPPLWKTDLGLIVAGTVGQVDQWGGVEKTGLDLACRHGELVPGF